MRKSHFPMEHSDKSIAVPQKFVPKQEKKGKKNATKSFPAAIGLTFHQEQLEAENKYSTFAT